MDDLLVVGGGASGMMAALRAAECGARVRLLERNEKLGKKIYITGKGRCNMTNDCTLEEFLREVPRNPRFLYSALAELSPQALMERMEAMGCPVQVQRGRRVFPASEKASDVTLALSRRLRALHVGIELNTRVSGILTEKDRVCGCTTEDGRTFSCRALILATGGLSAPLTGSTGDGYRLARETGHEVTPLRPSLTGICTVETWPSMAQGLSLKNVRLSAPGGKKFLFDQRGEMLLTHYGISGPLVLELTSHLPDSGEMPEIHLCLKPAVEEAELDARMVKDLSASPGRSVQRILEGYMPHSLARIFPEICGVRPEDTGAQINRESRKKLVRGLKDLTLHIRSLRPMDEAVITRGGVVVRQVDPGTMESRLLPGLFFAGELLDVDAHTGGYNLQIAFATGALAGRRAAEYCLREETV